MRRLVFLLAFTACAHRSTTTKPQVFSSYVAVPSGGSSASIGTVTQGDPATGSKAWPVAVTNTSDTIVKTGDSVNNAVRVNIVAGASSGAVAQGSTTSGQTGGLTQGAVTTAAPSYTTAQTSPLSLDTAGALRVNVTAGSAGGPSMVDNAGFTDGTTSIAPAGFIFDEVAGTALTENDGAAGRVDAKRAQVGVLEDATTRGRRATVTSGGALLTDASATTQPVSGTVAATESGTWTVQPGNTANTTAWKVDGSAVTQPVSGTVTANAGSGTFAMSGTVTANAGTNLNTSALALDASVTGLSLAQASTTSGQKGVLAQGAVTTAAPSYTTAQTSPFSLTTAGSLRLDLNSIVGTTLLAGNGVTGTGSPRVTIASDNTAFSVNAVQSGTWTIQPGNTANTTAWLFAGAKTNNNAAPGATNFGALMALANASAPTWTEGNLVLQSVLLNGNARTDLTSIAGTAPTTNNGTVGAGTLRMTIASDSSGNIATIGTSVVPGTSATHLGKAEDAAHTSGDTGVFMLGVRNQTGTIFASADGDYSPIGVDDSGAVFTRGAPSTSWNYHENSSSALTDTTVHASCGTGLFNYITSFTVSTGAATALNAFIEDSTSTTILGPYYLEAVAGRGFSIQYPGGKKQTNSATLVSVTTSAAIAHGIDVTGFCAP